MSHQFHSRGYLPHFQNDHLIQHIIFHLADSLPDDVIERISREILCLPAVERERERISRVEAWIDAGHGSGVLKQKEMAIMMQETLLHFHEERYLLHAWCIMPNHVHVLVSPLGSFKINEIVSSWKHYSARKINEWKRNATQERGVPNGPVWHREYWDRYMRDEEHCSQTIQYIHNNPVKAKLVQSPEQWAWSSASRLNQ